MNAIQETSRVDSMRRNSSNRKGGFNAFVERSIVALLFVAVTAAVCIRFDIKGIGKDFETMLTLRKLHEIAPSAALDPLIWPAAADEADRDANTVVVEDKAQEESLPHSTSASLYSSRVGRHERTRP